MNIIFPVIIGFGMWAFASLAYQFRMPFWYLFLCIAACYFAANIDRLVA